jgi:hypothetical protein
MGISTAFSGGLFLSAGLLHILPEAFTMFKEATSKEDDHHHDDKDHSALLWVKYANKKLHHIVGHGGESEEAEIFPFPFLAAVGSFVFILIFDKIIFNTH